MEDRIIGSQAAAELRRRAMARGDNMTELSNVFIDVEKEFSEQILERIDKGESPGAILFSLVDLFDDMVKIRFETDKKIQEDTKNELLRRAVARGTTQQEFQRIYDIVIMGLYQHIDDRRSTGELYGAIVQSQLETIDERIRDWRDTVYNQLRRRSATATPEEFQQAYEDTIDLFQEEIVSKTANGESYDEILQSLLEKLHKSITIQLKPRAELLAEDVARRSRVIPTLIVSPTMVATGTYDAGGHDVSARCFSVMDGSDINTSDFYPEPDSILLMIEFVDGTTQLVCTSVEILQNSLSDENKMVYRCFSTGFVEINHVTYPENAIPTGVHGYDIPITRANVDTQIAYMPIIYGFESDGYRVKVLYISDRSVTRIINESRSLGARIFSLTFDDAIYHTISKRNDPNRTEGQWYRGNNHCQSGSNIMVYKVVEFEDDDRMNALLNLVGEAYDDDRMNALLDLVGEAYEEPYEEPYPEDYEEDDYTILHDIENSLRDELIHRAEESGHEFDEENFDYEFGTRYNEIIAEIRNRRQQPRQFSDQLNIEERAEIMNRMRSIF